MKKILTLITSLAVLLPALAFAGLTQPAPVIVDLDNYFAAGDQWTARSSKNADELIGCGVLHIDDGQGFTYNWGFCQATDADGVNTQCFTETPSLLETMRATSAFAYIDFSWDEDGNCTRVRYSTQSFYLPRFTTKGEPDEDD
jgi:hypothetical protein